MSLSWVRGLVARRKARLLATATGVAVAVALIASIGAFLSGTTASMTARAIAQVPLDWQVRVEHDAAPNKVLRVVRAFPGVATALTVGYGRASGYSATKAGTSRSAGPGIVLGIPARYRTTFPAEITQLIGQQHGALVAQQLAANLGVRPGDTIVFRRLGQPGARVRVDGIIDLPTASSLFQAIPATHAATQPPPPDNVIVLPLARWHALFDASAEVHPNRAYTQIHANLIRVNLAADPVRATNQIAGMARNLETKLQGGGVVGNNLGDALAAARGDSLYARIAFLFLALPGAILAGLVTAAIAAVGGDRRRRDQALLRARGATQRDLLQLSLAETGVVAFVGGILGLVAASLIEKYAFGSGATHAFTTLWSGAAIAVGTVVAAGSIAVPAWRQARSLTVQSAGLLVTRSRKPLWAVLWLDIIALAASTLIFWRTGSNGYSLVIAVEGAPQVSVNYYSFLAPLLLWVGAGLLTWRLAELGLRRGSGVLSRLVSPWSGSLAGAVASTMRRQRRSLAGAITLVTLTVVFAASTAAFNSTYKQQAEADARLSNGADVVVREPRGTAVGPSASTELAAIRGVSVVEPLQHRYAYIGADLQDLFGVNASTIVANARLQDSFFKGGTANQLFARLAAKPDGILVSQEAVTDYQLRRGGRINLRLLDERTQKLIAVPFTYEGIALEFPTAPRDSFFIANANYIARTTRSAAVGTFLIQTGTSRTDRVAAIVADKLGPGPRVTDISAVRRDVSGSITSVELTGLIRVELGFALVLAAAATGLLLWAGLAERRRTFAIAQALGATPRQLGSFIWTETVVVALTGLVLGTVAATSLTLMLVKLLTGVFDPPPTSPSIPWAYLGVVGVVAAGAAATASIAAIHTVRRSAISTLRDL